MAKKEENVILKTVYTFLFDFIYCGYRKLYGCIEWLYLGKENARFILLLIFVKIILDFLLIEKISKGDL